MHPLYAKLAFITLIFKLKMKKGIHPENYRPVVFKDMSNGDMFLTKSTAKTNDTVEFEGETYPERLKMRPW